MKTQIQIIKEKLLTEGEVTNVWAVRNYILRLSAIIYDLRNEGMTIHGEYLTNKRGLKTKTFRYYI